MLPTTNALSFCQMAAAERNKSSQLSRGPCLLSTGRPIQLGSRLYYKSTFILPKTKVFFFPTLILLTFPNLILLTLSLSIHFCINFHQTDFLKLTNIEVFARPGFKKSCIKLNTINKNQKALLYVNSKTFQQPRLSHTPLHV